MRRKSLSPLKKKLRISGILVDVECGCFFYKSDIYISILAFESSKSVLVCGVLNVQP